MKHQPTIKTLKLHYQYLFLNSLCILLFTYQKKCQFEFFRLGKVSRTIFLQAQNLVFDTIFYRKSLKLTNFEPIYGLEYQNVQRVFLCFYIAFGLLSCSQNTVENKLETDQPKDSISVWIAKAKDTTPPVKELFLEKAYRATALLPEDSVKAKHLIEISYQYYKTDDSINFRNINKEAMQLTQKIRDSSRLARTYWDLGDYLSDKRYQKDSSYYYYSKAQQLYEGLKKNLSSARVLRNMAYDQSDIKDYTGAEINTIKAIKLLLPLKRYRELYQCYNNLGIIHDEFGNYDKALEYYTTASEYLRKTDKKNVLEPIALNNIGVTYKNKENYKKAIAYYKEAEQSNNLYAKDPEFEATLMDNIAYAKFKMGDATELPELFFDALNIRDSLNLISAINTSKLNLVKYYIYYKDTVAALKYAHEVRELAKASLGFKELLASLQLLSQLESCDKSTAYLEEYIKINDSLQLAERRLRGKFTRIQFETDQLIVEKEELTKDKATFKLFIISLSVLVLFIAGFAFYYYRRQRSYRLRFKTLLEEKQTETPQKSSKSKKEAMAGLDISETALNNILEQLKVFIDKKKYLNNTVSLNNWAKAMKTNPRYLSNVINFYKQKTFTDYIKDLRIAHTLTELKTNPVFRKYSIKAIAEEVGFNTAESFSKAFYKNTGIYPSYFIKELEKELLRKRSA